MGRTLRHKKGRDEWRSKDELAPFIATMRSFEPFKGNEATSYIVALRAASDPYTRQELATVVCARNFGLVMWAARRYRNLVTRHNLTLADLCQEGLMGLVKAVEKFDENRGVNFSTHAMWWIRACITRALGSSATNGLPRLPHHLIEVRRNLENARHELRNRNGGREPELHEIYALLRQQGNKAPSMSQVGSVLAHSAYAAMPLDAPVMTDSDQPGHEIVASHDADPEMVMLMKDELIVFQVTFRQADEVIRGMDERQRYILEQRMGRNGAAMTLEELGETFSLTRERIRQIEAKGSRKLQEACGLSLKDLGVMRETMSLMQEYLAAAGATAATRR